MRHVTVFGLSATLLMAAVIFGGGGTTSPLPELVVELAALLCAATYTLLPVSQRGVPVGDRVFFTAITAIVAVPIVQLVPLPPSIWHALPGRHIALQAMTLVHEDDSWRPLSLAPYATLASLLSLIAPLTMVFFVRRLSLTQRSALLGLMVALAVLAALVGVIQLAGGSAAWLHFYPQQTTRFATGFQGNRNTSADILLVGVLSLAGLLASRPGVAATTTGRLVLTGVAGFLVLSIILTGSRTGVALIAVCAIFALILFWERLRASRALLVGTVGSLLLIGGVGLVLKDNAAIRRTADRFETTQDQRTDLWIDTREAINQYWPVGAGVGTFSTVFPAVERLEVVDDSRPVRAHQDYLEFALEAGIAGILLLVALALAIGVRVITIHRTANAPARTSQAIYAVGVAMIVGLHSLVDYPLRSMAMATTFGMAIAMLARPAVEIADERMRRTTPRQQGRRPMAR